jgi:hypothetical protein
MRLVRRIVPYSAPPSDRAALPDTCLILDFVMMCDTCGPLDLASFVAGYRAMELPSEPTFSVPVRMAS